MKHVPVALVLASALFALCGALFFTASVSTRSPEEAPAPLRSGEDGAGALAALEARVEEAMARLSGVESAVARLEGELSARWRAGRSAPASSGDDAAAEEPAAGRGEEGEALGAALASGGEEGLRSFVHQVIQEERRREVEELRQGPYGQFNYRVNTLARKLGLSEYQKQRYHALLADYSGRIEELRKGLDRQDPAAYRSYREKKQALSDEFEAVVIQTLAPPQVQTYQELTPPERSPALEHAAGSATLAISTLDAGPGGAVRVLLGGDVVAPALADGLELSPPPPPPPPPAGR